MSRLPVIVGFGGVNPAGRSSGHHAYRRLVIDRLPEDKRARTFAALASLMQQPDSVSSEARQYMLEHTLIRKLETNLFDTAAVPVHKRARIRGHGSPLTFIADSKSLPDQPPANWRISRNEDDKPGTVTVQVDGDLDLMLHDTRQAKICSAGQLPSHFNPEALYQSRSHPRGLQLTVFGASDALNALGIAWQEVQKKVPPDQISVYAASAMGQLDHCGSAGVLQASLAGTRPSARNIALGLADMTAAFVNAYVLGNVGTTGANLGACATFLYNLRQGVRDIQSGKYRVALVGGSEAPLTADLMEGYRMMGALAEDEALMKLDGLKAGEPDYRRACRPFGMNCGFTLAEGAQFVILFDDELALETGASLYGAVGDVFINADGWKKSIPGPGIGNYMTVGKALGMVKAILGEAALRQRSYMLAHGTSTPQNRVTESHIFSQLAGAFGIEAWPVAAIKAYIGHSLSCASADQVIAALGVWQDGMIPGITSTHELAEDVHTAHLDFLLQHREIASGQMDAAFVNSKGFGGNNATAAILAPHIVRAMLKKKHGAAALQRHAARHEKVAERIAAYDDSMIAGQNSAIYNFGVGVIEGEALGVSATGAKIPGQPHPVSFQPPNPYPDMT